MDQATYQAFRDELVSAIWRDLDPLEDQIESTGEIPVSEVLGHLRAMGALGLLIPKRYGGAGLSVAQYIPIMAEFGKIQGGIRALVHVHNSMAHALAEMGSHEQCKLVLPGAVTGEHSVAFALTEPGHGTGADIGTSATRGQDGYLLNGEKWLITNSDFATRFIVFAKTRPGTAEDCVSAFLVERGTPGFDIQPLPETMGCRGGQHGWLRFTDARVPESARLGREGTGLAEMERALEISRVFVAASSLGTAERALELSVAFARERVTFGRPIAERQAVMRYLAEMATDVYALRHMLQAAAERYDAGERIPAEASMCKLFGLEAVGRVTDRALLTHGGIGYTRRHRIERLYRDARLNWLEEGTPTIQHLVIARELVTQQSSLGGPDEELGRARLSAE